ncbi:hypothetical protein [Nocardia suismassiliense]|uniref:hypothetical protein n=1 Tax=Nocardia suismassiliense TaxID=2077092 RepID=UPI00131F2056|nr:hypothetical protein [Nocardia suismassiliense]
MPTESHDQAPAVATDEPSSPDVAFTLITEFGDDATLPASATAPDLSSAPAPARPPTLAPAPSSTTAATTAAPAPPTTHAPASATTAASTATTAPTSLTPSPSPTATTELATAPAPAEDYAAEMRRSADQLAAAITDLFLPAAPPQWEQLRLGFSVTVAAVSGDAVFLVDDAPVVVEIPTEARELVQALRAITVPPGERAWWQVTLVRGRTGTTSYEFGYGDVAFPVDRLLPTAAYRADLEHFPRERLPVWLAARLRVDAGAQPLPQVLNQARLDRGPATSVRFLTAQTVWARWATVAAAAVAIGTEWGPRITGATAVFEGTDGSGSTLHLLPRGRAVLSGGLWNAPELDAAYNDGAQLPEYYAGVPDWLDGSVVNHRAFSGQLSFCYWWDGTNWSSGQSPAPTTIGAAIPCVWTPATVADIVCAVLGASASRPAVEDLLTAAESGSVTSDLAEAAFTTEDYTDVPGAWSQLALAGLTR